jgi:hypothetical protein
MGATVVTSAGAQWKATALTRRQLGVRPRWSENTPSWVRLGCAAWSKPSSELNLLNLPRSRFVRPITFFGQTFCFRSQYVRPRRVVALRVRPL